MVSDEAWTAAHARLSATRDYYLRSASGRLDGRPELSSPYLLTGLFRCASCGGPITAKGNRYYCDRRINRGERACSTFLSTRRDEADQAIIAKLTGFLDADRIERVLDGAVAKYAGKADQIERDKAEASAELAKVEAEITRTVGLVVKGIIAEDEAAGALKGARDRKALLQARLEHLDGQSLAPRIDRAALREHLAGRLTEWRALLAEHPIKARQIVKRLIRGAGRLQPQADGRPTEFEFEASCGKLLSGLIGYSEPVLPASEPPPKTGCAGEARARTRTTERPASWRRLPPVSRTGCKLGGGYELGGGYAPSGPPPKAGRAGEARARTRGQSSLPGGLSAAMPAPIVTWMP